MHQPIKVLLIALLVLILGYAAVHKAYLVRGTYSPSDAMVQELRRLGGDAIASGDVPVASLLLYNDSIIGRGRNTVLLNGDAAGHAEVNAVSDALHSLGPARFARLDREHLLLLTTFEPCAMCRGLMLEHRIDRVAFIEPKSVFHWLREDLRALRIDLRQQLSRPEHLQDSLFRAHPAYDPAKADH